MPILWGRLHCQVDLLHAAGTAIFFEDTPARVAKVVVVASLNLKSLWMAPGKIAPIFRCSGSISESLASCILETRFFSFAKIASA